MDFSHAFPRSLEKALLARSTAIALFLLLLASMLVASFVPQRLSLAPVEFDEWRREWPSFSRLALGIGLDHVYGSWWFAVLLVVLAAALGLSTARQLTSAWRRSHRPSWSSDPATMYPAALPLEDLLRLLRRRGYFPLWREGKCRRLVKFVWGYWGNAFFHLGLLLVVLSGLFMALTRQAAELRLNEGGRHGHGDAWLHEEHGMLTAPLVFPGELVVRRVIPEYWETGEARQVSSLLSLLDTDGRERLRTVSVNQPLTQGQVRIYQTHDHGQSFFLECLGPDGGREQLTFRMKHPKGPEGKTYDSFRFADFPFTVEARYEPGAGEKAPLAVRFLDEAGFPVGELWLGRDGGGQLGPYIVRLVHTMPWTRLVFARMPGINGVFAGFALVILGAGLIYFFPPREIVLLEEESGVRLAWYATRFVKHGREELDCFVSRIS